MKKVFALFCISLLLRLPLDAQLPSGTTAPNFKATDLKGTEWELYDLLRANKVVVMEVMATWCSPCWSYYNSEALKNLYALHGPEGTDRLQVLMVEGDKETSRDCLLGLPGCTKGTFGDYTQGIRFPILDDAGIADLYRVRYYPTVYIICPNKKVYEANTWDAGMLWEKTQTCPVAKGINNAGIFDLDAGSVVSELCDTTAVMPALSVVNLGAKPLQSASIQLKLDGVLLQNIQWNGNLDLYEQTRIFFDPAPLQYGQMELTLSDINGQADADPSNNTRIVQFKPAASFSDPAFVLRLRTDDYGFETYWEVRDEQHKVLKSGGNKNVGPTRGGLPLVGGDAPGTYASNAIIKDTITLPGPGCYSIHFSDAFGDGLCCNYGTGYYRLYDLKNPSVPVLSGGEFGAYERRGFQAGSPVVGAGEPATPDADIDLYPNPATDQLNVSVELPPAFQQAAASIVNALGQIQTKWTLEGAGMHTFRVNVQHYPPGLYFAVVRSGRKQWMQRFIVAGE